MRFFDLHCDTLYKMVAEKQGIYKNDFHVSLSKASEYNPYIGCFAVWIPDELRGNEAFKFLEKCVNKLFAEEKKLKGEFEICKTSKDLENVLIKGKKGVILTLEGSAALMGDISKVKFIHDIGVKIVTLTWNGSCEAGDGVGVSNARGLTQFGRELVSALEKSGIIIDISHASERLFYDVCHFSSKPFIATHSNSKSICNHRRNLSDDQFKIIRDLGGIVGVTFCDSFLKEAGDSSFDDILRHMDYFLSLDGKDTICIGSDFDGSNIPKMMYGIESMEALYEYFLKKNYKSEILDKIFFGNAYNFLSNLF